MYHFQRRLLNAFSAAKKTCLNEVHLENHGRMVDFAGYELPVQYKAGIVKEHLHCRSSASIFDVSHMGQITIKGPDARKLLQRVTVGSTDRKKISVGKNQLRQGYLTLFLNENAGIIDDGIVCIDSPTDVRMVVNGANKHIVMDHIQQVNKQEKLNAKIQLHDDLGLIALQGPKSSQVLQRVLQKSDTKPQLKEIPFMAQTSFKSPFDNQQTCHLSRSGYTGEDGFEISGSGKTIVQLTKKLLEFKDEVALAGLGSRDSLRAEAGLCLHGHDISPKTTPLQAGLMWCVYKKEADKGRVSFIGEDKLRNQAEEVKAKKTQIKKRVGFQLDGSGIVREHCKVTDNQQKQIGQTTTGIYSPSLKTCLGMAYVDQKQSKQGTKIKIQQRGKTYDATIKKMPFVPANYYRDKKWE